MKVGTDALLLGSWANISEASSVLDIGTGSGILAIMLAQKSQSNCQVVGIDIDAGAVGQATKNMHASPWSERLSCIQVGICDYQPPGKFDVIISNPPFFAPKAGNLSVDDPNFISPSRRAARHTNSLDLASLLGSAGDLLSEKGAFYCILPSQILNVESLAEQYGLYCSRRLQVYSKPNKLAIRQLYCLTKHQIETVEQTITIYDEQSRYSEDYQDLCKDFYLNF